MWRQLGSILPLLIKGMLRHGGSASFSAPDVSTVVPANTTQHMTDVHVMAGKYQMRDDWQKSIFMVTMFRWNVSLEIEGSVTDDCGSISPDREGARRKRRG
jgi:hypothetical protein